MQPLSGGTTTYKYDPEGQLIYENGSSGTQVFQRDMAGHLTAILTPQGASKTSVLDMAAYVDGELIGSWRNSNFTFAGNDWLGNRRYESTGNGDVASTAEPTLYQTETFTNLPFGDALSSVGEYPTHFTGKERDAESGNDYFGARYYASTMGRFMSPDWAAKAEPVPYAKLDNPQSLNLYTYVGNNPLSRMDPDGHYQCRGTKDQCAQFQTGLNLAKAAMNNLGADSKGGKAIGAVLKFYGSATDKNGVNVSFGDLQKGELGYAAAGAHGTVNIKFDLNQINGSASRSGISGTFAMSERAGNEIHEGQHGVDDRARGGGTSSARAIDATEHNAYGTESYVFEGLGVNSAQGLWSTGWNPGEAEADRATAVDWGAKASDAVDCAGGVCQP